MGSLPSCHLRLVSCKPMSCAYPRVLKTLGDHVRKCRLDLGLDQMTTGQRMGVHGGTVWNWESGQRKPETKNLPAIIAFLGYDPRPDPGSLTERLVWYREGKGWSQERMAEFLRVDEATISGWERGEHAPTRKSVEKIEMALRQSRYPTVGGAGVRPQASRARNATRSESQSCGSRGRYS